MKNIMVLCAGLAVAFILGCQSVPRTAANYRPHEGYVPDAETAIRIAEAVWLPIYGKKQIESERPFVAELSGDVWTVTGSLPDGWVGGTAEIDLRKSDGTILRVIHGK
jgi:hypothetical protein